MQSFTDAVNRRVITVTLLTAPADAAPRPSILTYLLLLFALSTQELPMDPSEFAIVIEDFAAVATHCRDEKKSKTKEVTSSGSRVKSHTLVLR